jgi:hypothetical protein
MVRFCLDRARECRRAAERGKSPSGRRFWLAMEGRWFFLARSYDSEQRAEGMATGEARARAGVVVPLEWRAPRPMAKLAGPDRARG